MKKPVLILFLSVLFFSMAKAQLCPGYTLGPDTVTPCGSSVTLHAPAGWNNYLWSNNSTASSITTTNTGNFWCRSIDTLSNVVANGDFAASGGFSSDYIPGTGGTWGLLSNPGTYAVTTNPNLVHSNFPFCYDHTSGNGTSGMLVVNGASVANQRAWYQTVAVQPNTTYIFSVWFSSVDPGSPAILQFSVNNFNLGAPFMLSASTCWWQNFFGTWNSGSNTTATISILNQNTAGGGNDFAIDDILFAPICVMRDTINVSHPPAPVVTVTGGDTICSGDSIWITATSNTPNSTFQWSGYAGNNTDSLHVAPTTNTYYSVRAGYMNCWSGKDSSLVTMATPFTASLAGASAICPGGSAQLTATVNGGWGTVQTLWNPGAATGTTINVSPAATTTYTFYAADNCMADTLTHLLTVYPDPNASVTITDNQQCVPLCTSFNLNSATTAQTVHWDYGDNNTGTGVNPNHCYPVAGTFDVSVTVQDANGCADTVFLPALIQAYPLPVADFTTDPFLITSLDPVIDFTNESIGATLFSWTFGDGGTSSDQDPTHTYIPAAILTDDITVQLIVQNQYGCGDTIQKTMAVQNLVTFYIPNAFTPNGDGKNELFFPKGDGVSRMRTQIFNRWGQIVFESYDMYAAWDGKDQKTGDICPQGVYVYVVDVMDQYAHEQRYMERISLIR